METTGEQQYAQVTACAFTGHRPTRFSFKHDEAHPACIELKKVQAEQIDFLPPAIPSTTPRHRARP